MPTSRIDHIDEVDQIGLVTVSGDPGRVAIVGAEPDGRQLYLWRVTLCVLFREYLGNICIMIIAYCELPAQRPEWPTQSDTRRDHDWQRPACKHR